MKEKIKILFYLSIKNILKYLPIYSKHDFNLNTKSKFLDNNKSNIKLNENTLYPNNFNKITLTCKKKIDSGWYIFGILHHGENEKCYGNIFLGNSYFVQGRPMFPRRRRWRIIRIKSKSNAQIILENIYYPLKLNEIWFFKVPFFEAWRRIRNRCQKFNSFVPGNFANKQGIKKVWRLYNLELKNQKNLKNDNLFNYDSWQKKVEKKSIQKLSKITFLKNINFAIQDPENPFLVKKDAFIILKKSQDKLPPWIEQIIKYLVRKDKNIELIFGDEDFIDVFGKRYDPHFKGAWNRELFWSNPNVCNSWIISKKYWNKSISFLREKNYIINTFSIINYITFDLEKNNKLETIKHIPLILYHNSSRKKTKIEELNKKNIDFLYKFINRNQAELGTCLNIENIKNKSCFKYDWAIPKESLLSILIPTRDKVDYLQKCINSIEKYNPGIPYEILIIDNESQENKTKLYLKEFISKRNNTAGKIISYKGRFNFSKMNNQIAEMTRGDVIIFLNNDVEFTHCNWGYELASNAFRPGIGFVGCKLLFEDNTIQHAGVILGIGGIAGHAFKYFDRNSEGYFGRLNCSQEYSALTAACLAISKKNWLKLEGFNELNLPVNYNDVDICLEARQIGLRNLYLPSVEAFHYESKTRGRLNESEYKLWKKERKFFRNKWRFIIEKDPSYSPYLSLIKEDFSMTLKLPKNIQGRSCTINSYR